MNYQGVVAGILTAFLIVAAHVDVSSAANSKAVQESVQMKAGAFFPATKQFDPGNGIDLVYSLKVLPFTNVDLGVGYYRAERDNSAFLSAVPVTIGLHGTLPLPYLDLYAGVGGGAYYKMVQLTPQSSAGSGLTEVPSDSSEVAAGYYLNAGIAYAASPTLSLLLDIKHVTVDQGKYRNVAISHDGTFVYGGFMVNF